MSLTFLGLLIMIASTAVALINGATWGNVSLSNVCIAICVGGAVLNVIGNVRDWRKLR